MDFNEFDSRTAASQPRELHLRHPSDGSLLFNDPEKTQPCIVLVRGLESPQVQQQMAAIQQSRVGESQDASVARTTEDLHRMMVDTTRPLIAGFRNINRRVDGELRPVTLADVDWFLSMQMLLPNRSEKSFAEQITAFASKRANFLSRA